MMKFLHLAALSITGIFLTGCAGLIGKPSDRINVMPTDRIFLRVTPFDSTVQGELTRAGLDAEVTEEDLSSELHYQFFLKKQEESPDSAGATVRVTVSIRHLQPGAGNSGGFASGMLMADRAGKIEQANWESRQSAKENVPGDFLPLHIPRFVAGEILGRMKGKPKPSAQSDMERNPPLMLLH